MVATSVRVPIRQVGIRELIHEDHLREVVGIEGSFVHPVDSVGRGDLVQRVFDGHIPSSGRSDLGVDQRLDQVARCVVFRTVGVAGDVGGIG